MSKGLQALRVQRAAKAKELQELVAKTDWDAAKDQPVYDAGMAEVESIDKQIANHVKLNEAAVNDWAEGLVAESVLANPANTSETRKIYQKWLKGGDRALTNEDYTTIRNTMSTGTDAEGGFTVATEVASTILEALKAYGGVREIATVISTASGNGMNWPTSDGTSEEGEIVAENADAADEDAGFGVKSLEVFKYSSKVITVPIELLQDSAVDIEAFVQSRLISRLGRITSRHHTVGTGTGQPMGFVTAAAVGVAAAAADSHTYDELVELEHSVDPAYRKNPGSCFAMHDSAVKNTKLIKDTEGRPIFVPGYDPATMNQQDMILGYRVKTLQEMAEPAANAKSIAFGDFQKHVIRDAMDLVLHRFTDSAYAKKGQVGFLGFLRSGSNLMDVGGAIKVLQQSA